MGPDFIVLGAEERAAASLCARLGAHAAVWMPPSPVQPLVDDEEGFARGADWFQHELLAAPDSALAVGISAPELIAGTSDAGPQLIARRLATALPEVRLVALLSDPIARALSSHCLRATGDLEEKPIDELVEELLDPARLEAARWREPGAERCLVDGEYGRILASYAAVFPRDQILIAFSEELERRPAALISHVLGFLGLDEDPQPAEYDDLDPTWRSSDGEAVRAESPRLSEPVREELERLYRRDLEILEELFDVEPPWGWARGS